MGTRILRKPTLRRLTGLVSNQLEPWWYPSDYSEASGHHAGISLGSRLRLFSVRERKTLFQMNMPLDGSDRPLRLAVDVVNELGGRLTWAATNHHEFIWETGTLLTITSQSPYPVGPSEFHMACESIEPELYGSICERFRVLEREIQREREDVEAPDKKLPESEPKSEPPIYPTSWERLDGVE